MNHFGLVYQELALALRVLTGVSYYKAAMAVFAVWLLSRAGLVLIGMG